MSLKNWLKQRRRPVFIAAIALTTAMGAAACRHGRSPEDRVARAKSFLSDRLDLDEAQDKKLDVLGDEILGLVRSFKAERDADMPALIAQVRSNLDKEALSKAAQKRRALVDQKLPTILDRLVEFHQSLNNEQKEQIAEWMEKHSGRRDE